MSRPVGPPLLLTLALAASGCGDDGRGTAESAASRVARGWRLAGAEQARPGARPLVLSLGRDGSLAATLQDEGSAQRGEPARLVRDGAWRLEGDESLCLRFGAQGRERCEPLQFQGNERMRWGNYAYEPFDVTAEDLAVLEAPPEDSAPAQRASPPPPDRPMPSTSRRAPSAPDREARRGTPRREAVASARAEARAAPADRSAGAAMTPADSMARCGMRGDDDQRICLFAHISRNDADLRRIYRELIAELRRRDGGREPASVRELRTEEARWLERRDRECREQGRGREGALWGAARASCFRRHTDDRADELRMRLAEVRAGMADPAEP